MREQFTYVQAQQFALKHSIIARVNSHGNVVLFYTGEESQPGTWMEIGRARIREGVVDARSVKLICGAA